MPQVVLKGSHNSIKRYMITRKTKNLSYMYVTHYTKASCNLPKVASYVVLRSYLSLVILHCETTPMSSCFNRFCGRYFLQVAGCRLQVEI